GAAGRGAEAARHSDRRREDDRSAAEAAGHARRDRIAVIIERVVLYVYAITRNSVMPDAEGVDGSWHFGVVCGGNVCAVYTPVDFTQEMIDQRAGDLEWLGAIGYRHQTVIADLMDDTAVIPLRAFTMFSSESALHEHLTTD